MRKRRTLGKVYGDKSVRTYWGTCWELEKPLGNKKKTKNIPLPQTQIWGL
jgi:hypothetical protein